ncbi:restriction endonuclease [Burkholderia cepacia]|uniref:restriction endonuclease n=1 Tax=Burkholderia cepacia complex TaxID=87882 RepID=UPI001589662B|nr:restriction endonuclease [Burkholderia cenocepacia]EKS9844462.1 restriction endonuclease [Burkholderia cepacia]MBJ9924543.1 restriction endonuclease [Burkholderia cenocepacia]
MTSIYNHRTTITMNTRPSSPKRASKWTDQDVEDEIEHVRDSIYKWAKRRELWIDSGFKSHLEHSESEPSKNPVVLYFYSDGGMESITVGDFSEEFARLVEGLGYQYEQEDSVTMAIYVADDDIERRNKFYEYFHWKWVCSLLIEDTGDVYEELYAHFKRNPHNLHKLHWREFEILLFRIFQNHGYKALLGPGQGDGGVDLRLWQKNPLGDILTVVQAKRYAPSRKIEQTPVAALYGVSKVERADKALFVTTSSYTPAARNFAARVSSELEIAEKEQIVDWCDRATNGVIQDKSALIDRASVERLVNLLALHPDGRIVHATRGYNMVRNSYAIVIKETKHAALLLSIGKRAITDDGSGQVGTEVPLLDISTMKHFNKSGVRRALRQVDESGEVTYWDGENLYTPWDKKPNYFDYLD